MSKTSALNNVRRNQLITQAMYDSSKRHEVRHPGVADSALRLGYIDNEPLSGCVSRLQSVFEIAVDGWPGNEFLCALWQDNKPDADFVRQRVISCMQSGDVDYVLGAGSPPWFGKQLDNGEGADCSAFVAWSLMRRKAGGPDWKNSKGQSNWLHTGSIVHDATGPQQMFCAIAEPQPWSIFSYADSGGKQGHTGWVVDVRDGLEIIDCSSSQSRNYGDAVRQRSGEWLRNRDDVVYCVPVWW